MTIRLSGEHPLTLGPSRPKRTYVNGLLALFQTQSVLNWLMALLMSASLRRLDPVWLPELVLRAAEFLRRVRRNGRRLSQGDWSPIRAIFRRGLARLSAHA
ncbi:MAG: hypothetical protein HYX94_11585 [Chloroflexi bacterium]|nr:hypothetical protein [Chloroflexota bacterium]